MKFGQLKQYSREILLWRSHTKCGEETSSRPFSKKNQNWAFISIRNLKIYTVFFLFMSSSRAIKIYWNWHADELLMPHLKLLLKTERETSLAASFSTWFFEQKCFSGSILSTSQISWSNYFYLLRFWETCLL